MAELPSELNNFPKIIICQVFLNSFANIDEKIDAIIYNHSKEFNPYISPGNNRDTYKITASLFICQAGATLSSWWQIKKKEKCPSVDADARAALCILSTITKRRPILCCYKSHNIAAAVVCVKYYVCYSCGGGGAT